MHRNILVIIEEILKILSKEKELSIRQISLKAKTHRVVALKSLEFFKRINLVKEREVRTPREKKECFLLLGKDN